VVIAVFTKAHHLFLLWAGWFLQYAVIISLYTTYQSLWFVFGAYYVDEYQVLKRWRFFHTSSWGPRSPADGCRKEKIYKSWFEHGSTWHFWYNKIWRIKRKVTNNLFCFPSLQIKLPSIAYVVFLYIEVLFIIICCCAHKFVWFFMFDCFNIWKVSTAVMMLYNLWMELSF
jgi:hypothetical protein